MTHQKKTKEGKGQEEEEEALASGIYPHFTIQKAINYLWLKADRGIEKDRDGAKAGREL
jgi:hypothetical protein